MIDIAIAIAIAWVSPTIIGIVIALRWPDRIKVAPLGLEVSPVAWPVPSGFGAITIGAVTFARVPMAGATARHEWIHRIQWWLLGGPVFVLWYFGEYGVRRLFGAPRNLAYHNLTLERWARRPPKGKNDAP